jgi:molecular chaperone DnaJ
MHPGIPAGDLIVNIRIQPHPTWIREGDNLIYEKNVDVWDAITGSTITFTTIDGKVLNVSMPAGTQPETVLSCKGEGMPNMRTQKRGNLLIKIKISVPKNLNSSDIEKIRKLKNELSTRTT